MDPTVEEWTDLAVRMLQEQVVDSPTLTHLWMNLTCLPPPQEPTLRGVRVYFDDASSSGFLPSARFAYVWFNYTTDMVAMYAAEYPLDRPREPLQLDAVKVGWRDALRIAQQHGGDSFQTKTQDVCNINLWLGDYGWRIEYMAEGVEDLSISIDAGTGEVLENP